MQERTKYRQSICADCVGIGLGQTSSPSLTPLIKSGPVSFSSDGEQGWPTAFSDTNKISHRPTDITAKCGVPPLLKTIILAF